MTDLAGQLAEIKGPYASKSQRSMSRHHRSKLSFTGIEQSVLELWWLRAYEQKKSLNALAQRFAMC
jgi:hypothetical protein